MLLEAWKALETAQGDADSLAKVEAMMPRVVKKMRKVDGDTSMMEECQSRLSDRSLCLGEHFAEIFTLFFRLSGVSQTTT